MDIFTPPHVKEKAPPGRRPRFSMEFMMMVARKCVEEGMTYREAASTFGTSHGSIHAWIIKYNNRGKKSKRNETSSKYKQEVESYRHNAHIKDLKHEIAELYLENLMLKKALKHSLQSKSEDLSVITSENLDQSQEAAE